MATKRIDMPPRPMGMELFEITPVILGGDPVDPKNKAWLTRRQHFEAVRYWNRVIRDLRQSKAVVQDDGVR